MKSKTMKVLHEVAGRSMVGHVPDRGRRCSPGAGRRGRRPPARAGRPAHPRAACRRAARGPGRAARHRARGPGGDGGARRRGGPPDAARCWWPTATPRCSRGRRSRPSPRSTRPPQRAVSILSGRGGRPLRLRPGGARRGRRGRGDRRGAGRDRRRSAAIARDQLRDPGLRRRLPRRGAAPAAQRQRQGRVLPHRPRRPRARGRAARRRPPRSTTSARPRAPTTASSWRATRPRA